MTITFLGTGTSTGVPMIGCTCDVCRSTDVRDKRLRTSAVIDIDGKKILIDTSPDLRYQLLREGIDNIDAILITHKHKDHLSGLDEMRAISNLHNKAIPVYASAETVNAIHKDFYYVFQTQKYPGILDIDIHAIDESPFDVMGIPIIPIKVKHAAMDVWGFRIGNLTYITDANAIADAELDKIKDSQLLVLNALRKEKHFSHFTLNEAIALTQPLHIPQIYLTHISHQMGFHQHETRHLPPHYFFAYDGLKVEL